MTRCKKMNKITLTGAFSHNEVVDLLRVMIRAANR